MTSGELENQGGKAEDDAELSTASASSGSHKNEAAYERTEKIDRLRIDKADYIKKSTNADDQKNKFSIGKNEEHDRLQENKNFTGNSRSPSAIYSEYGGEVLLRSPYQYGNRIVSAVVAPSKNPLGQRKINSTGDLENLATPGRLFSSNNKGKKENMVLQLVLPPGNQNNIYENNNYLAAKSIDEILENGHLKERPHSINSQQDFYTPLANGSYINCAYSAGDLSQYGHPVGTPGGNSERQTSSSDQNKPTPPKKKKQAFIDLVTTVLSIFYALFIVTMGLAIYVGDVIHGGHQSAEIFSLILVVIALLYIAYLTLDISFYMIKKRRYEKLLEQNTPEEIEMKETVDGHFQFSITLPKVVTLKKSLNHHYCFNKDRHSTNFYLKMGAAAFCFGHLIHSGLLLGYQLVFLTTGEISFYECGSVVQVILDCVYPIYSFLLLFFMFKYSNIIINRNIVLARFCIMHCLSSSICFWIWTIFRETVEALAHYEYETNTTTTEPDDNYHSQPLTSYNRTRSTQVFTDYIAPSPRRFTVACDQDDQSLSTIYRIYSPYLYPFSVEFSILVVGVLFLVWQNIGMCKAQDGDDEASTRQCKDPSGSKDNMESNVVVHVDCQSSNKGLFGGFLILVLTIVSAILFFIAIYGEGGRRGEIGVTVNIATSLIILITMTLACLFAYRQITKLDLNTAHHNLLDDVLLFICIPAYLLNGIFSITPAVIYGNVVGSINICLEVLQVLLQTSFILDGLRRSSNTKSLKLKKPGREMVTFLVICNVALWIMQTFEVKSHGMQDNRYDFYGKELWTILGHMCLPLMMFYRFHSSVCLGDIWKYAYESSGH